MWITRFVSAYRVISSAAAARAPTTACSPAARLIREKNYGNMVGLVNGKIVPVPLSEVAGKLKTVPVDCEEILAAREIGISFGD